MDEVGVSGVFRRHGAWNIDLGPFILTAALADVDPRLRDESTDWCIRADWSPLLASEPWCGVDSRPQRLASIYAATVRH
jgi:hypothetical protein